MSAATRGPSKLGLVGLLDIGRIQWQFDRIAARVSVTEPWNSKGAAELDAMSLGGWLRSVRRRPVPVT